MSVNGNGHKSLSTWWRRLAGRRNGDELDAYRRLAVQLHYDLSAAGASQSVLLVSPGTSQLCACSSALLACCAADELGRSVLLVDICPRDPAASRLLGCSQRPGFAELLSEPQEMIENLVLSTSCHGVSFIPAGAARQLAAPARVGALQRFLQAAESRYDMVILAGGAILADPSALVVAPYAGCVLLAVVENQTRMDDLEAAQSALSRCQASRVGLLLTTPLPRRMPAFTAAVSDLADPRSV